MSDEVCSQAWATAIHIYTGVVYSLVVFMFSIALYVQCRLRRAFHPFFTMNGTGVQAPVMSKARVLVTLLFAETMLCYALCDAIVVILKIINFFGAMEHPIAALLDTLFHYSYILIMPLQSCCLVERLVATLFLHTYEKSRKWAVLALSQPFSIGYLILNDYAQTTAVTSAHMALFFLIYYLVQTAGLIALLIVNQRLTRKYTGSGISLSARYQLSENIRTIRVFLPMIIFDTLISLIDIATHYLKLTYIFKPEHCTSDSSYFLAIYIVTELIGSGLELIEATLIVCSYPNAKEILFRWKATRSHRVASEGPSKIVNVFGSDLMSQQKSRNHFDDLNNIWELQPK